MKLFQRVLFCAWIALCISPLALAEEADSEPEELSSAPVSIANSKFFVPCEFDTFKTMCLLDSGSSFSTVSNSQFDHYAPWGHIKYNGGTGREIEVNKIYIQKLNVAQLHLKSWPVARLPHQPGFLNIIGLDVFSKSPVLFDFKKLTITFNADKPDKLSNSSTTMEYGMLELPVKIGEIKLNAVWDTGASMCIVDKDYVSNHPNDFTFIKNIEGTDATRTDMPMALYKINELVIGGLVLKDLHVAAMDFSGMKKVHASFPMFFLGYNALIGHVWYFDLREDQWGVE